MKDLGMVEEKAAAARTEPVVLTTARIEALEPREKRYQVSDARVTGLVVRVFPTGSKSFYVKGRLGKGRAAKRVEVNLGAVGTVTLAEARERAAEMMVSLRRGEDPRVKAEKKVTLAELIEKYAKRLDARGVAKRAEVISALERGLKKHMRAPAEDLTRRQVVALLDKMESDGRAGAAQYLRKSVVSMLNWAVEKADLLNANVMGGYKREKATKAEAAAKRKPITFKAEDEIRAFWRASGMAGSAAFRDYLRFLLLVGTRRTETALMEWSQVSLGNKDEWVIPPEQTKMGRAHTVYLGPMSKALLESQPRYNATELVFPGRRLRPMSGWSKMLKPVKQALGDEGFAFHALRRTYRTGLSELGVPYDVAEVMIAHAREDLHGRYDKSTMEHERRQAQQKWEAYIERVVGNV